VTCWVMVLQHMRDWVLLQDGEVRWMTAAEAVRARERRVKRLENCILEERWGVRFGFGGWFFEGVNCVG